MMSVDDVDGFEILSIDIHTSRFPDVSELSGASKETLKHFAANCKLDDRGTKKTLTKRLRTFLKRRRATNAGFSSLSKNRFFDYLCVLDFECTCEAGRNPAFPHEIIEFPALLVDALQCKVVDEFHSYCKPVLNPTLSRFCRDLTGISQEQVDSADEFPIVLERFNEWLTKHGLMGTNVPYAFLTDGPWDLGRFLQLQMAHNKSPIPHHMRYWINVRKVFCQLHHVQKVNLAGMLQRYGLKFEGRPHCGLDDAKNICRVVFAMLDKGAELRINQSLVRADKADLLNAKKLQLRRQLRKGAQSADELAHCQEEKEPPLLPNVHFSVLYKVVGVTKNEFLLNLYEECYSCEDSDSEAECDDCGDSDN